MKTRKSKSHQPTGQLQQGDVISLRLPDGFLAGRRYERIRPDIRGIVLAEGEHTGHYHGIECEEGDAELVRVGEMMLLQVNNPVVLKHAEHGPVEYSPGIWQIGHVVEKDWLNDMVERVAD